MPCVLAWQGTRSAEHCHVSGLLPHHLPLHHLKGAIGPASNRLLPPAQHSLLARPQFSRSARNSLLKRDRSQFHVLPNQAIHSPHHRHSTVRRYLQLQAGQAIVRRFAPSSTQTSATGVVHRTAQPFLLSRNMHLRLVRHTIPRHPWFRPPLPLRQRCSNDWRMVSWAPKSQDSHNYHVCSRNASNAREIPPHSPRSQD